MASFSMGIVWDGWVLERRERVMERAESVRSGRRIVVKSPWMSVDGFGTALSSGS